MENLGSQELLGEMAGLDKKERKENQVCILLMLLYLSVYVALLSVFSTCQPGLFPPGSLVSVELVDWLHQIASKLYK